MTRSKNAAVVLETKTPASKLSSRNNRRIALKLAKEPIADQIQNTEPEPFRVLSPVEEESDVLCLECDTPIPPARLKLVKHQVCVDCMSELERKGRGTVRHRMDVDTVGDIEDIEEVRVSIVRGE
jgi:RNA polymerase-binding transcription factor DksA